MAKFVFEASFRVRRPIKEMRAEFYVPDDELSDDPIERDNQLACLWEDWLLEQVDGGFQECAVSADAD